MDPPEVGWGGGRAATPTWADVERVRKRARLAVCEAELPLDFTLIRGERGFLLTVGEEERSFVTFACGSFEYVLNGAEVDPPLAFLYGGSYSEVDANRSVLRGEAEQALRAFFEMGERPMSLPWETLPPG